MLPRSHRNTATQKSAAHYRQELDGRELFRPREDPHVTVNKRMLHIRLHLVLPVLLDTDSLENSLKSNLMPVPRCQQQRR